MATSADRQAMISALRRFPSLLEAAVRGLTDEQLSARPGEKEWSIRQVVHHLADTQFNQLARTKFILTGDKPKLNLIDSAAWGALPDSIDPPISASLAILSGAHERFALLLERLTEAEWLRAGLHPKQGEMTIEQILGICSRHMEDHLRQIAEIKKSQAPK